MIKVYLLDFSGADENEINISALPDYILKTKNPPLRRERIFSYLLLRYACEELSLSPVPAVERDGFGRPYFVGEEIDFNLSHDGSVAALIISDEGRVGIDVQRASIDISDRLKEKTEAIFRKTGLSAIKESRVSKEMKMLEYKVGSGIVCIPSSKIKRDVNASDFFSKWTLTEAAAKADGRGIALFSVFDFSPESFSFERVEIRDRQGNGYALCICKKEK